jgi:hypothetical protein
MSEPERTPSERFGIGVAIGAAVGAALGRNENGAS